jgi:type I restriction enzyme S subunit
VATYRGQDDNANVNQHVCIIRLNQKKALPEYVSFHLSTSSAQEQIWTIQAGASRQALNFDQVRSLSLYLPEMKEQGVFANFVNRTHALKERQRQTTEEINELFHSLVHRAFTGRLVS